MFINPREKAVFVLATEAVGNAFTELKIDIPYISFPSNWEIQITYPQMAEVARFLVKLPNKEKHVWVVLDISDMDPWWEIFSAKDREYQHVSLNDTDELIRVIQKSLDGLDNKE